MSHAMPARRLRLGRVARSRASVRPSKQDATVGQGAARGKVHVQYVFLCVYGEYTDLRPEMSSLKLLQT